MPTLTTEDRQLIFERGVHSDAFLIQTYENLVYPRIIEEKMLSLLRQGKISKWFSGIGQEAEQDHGSGDKWKERQEAEESNSGASERRVGIDQHPGRTPQGLKHARRANAKRGVSECLTPFVIGGFNPVYSQCPLNPQG